MNRVRVERWLRRAAVALGVGYPVALLVILLALRLIGEGWAPTAVGLYLPRWGFALPRPVVLGALAGLRLRRLLWAQLAAVALLLVLMGLVLPWPHGVVSGAPRMRVLSYNIDSAKAGADRVVAEIDAYAPDVVLLQEVGRPGDVETLLRQRYPVVETSSQFILASRYPLVDSTDPDKLDYGGKQRSPRFVRRVLDTPLGRIAVYDVHPISPREAFDVIRAGGLRHEILHGHIFRAKNAKAVNDNFGLRALQVETIAHDAAGETLPVVIAGDTNLPGLSRVFGRNLSGYTDGFRAAGWGFGYTYPVGKHSPWMRIDRVLASGALRFVGFQVGTSEASDHHCVVADLQRETP